jgi:molybdopterin synthase catalytic subunit
MYASIRRYTSKTTTTKEAIDDLKHRIEEKFTPIVQEIRGFHTYGVVNVGDKELVSISIFEDRNGAAESTRRAAEFVQKDPMKDQLGKPEVLEGELLVLKEAGVSVR